MKGYSKIKEKYPLAERSKSKKEFQFADHDFDRPCSKPSPKRNPDGDEDQLPSTIDNNEKNRKKIELFLDKLQELEHDDPRKNGGERNNDGVLRRNYSVSSAITNQKNKGKVSNFQQIEKQGSSKSIHGAMKRAFSLRSSSSVSGSDRYCRIYDQPMSVDDDGFDHHNNHDYDDIENNDYNDEENGSMEMRSVNRVEKKDLQNNGKKKVSSKVVKACKRLFTFSR